jgi:hypothetical protein
MCRLDIEATIDVPPSGFFILHPQGARLCYEKNGRLKYIHLLTPVSLAVVLKKHGIIDCYDPKTGAMFRKSLLTVVGPKGEPVQNEKLFEVKREDIHLNVSQMQTIAAQHEMSRNKVIKMFIRQHFTLSTQSKVVNMFNLNQRAA